MQAGPAGGHRDCRGLAQMVRLKGRVYQRKEKPGSVCGAARRPGWTCAGASGFGGRPVFLRRRYRAAR